MTSIDRKTASERLQKRIQENYDRREGDINYKYFNPDLDLPLWRYRVTKGEPHMVDIIPFQAGKNYPQLDKRNPIKEGTDVYVLEVYVHQNIGPQKMMIICPARNYGNPCPVCDDIASKTRDGAEYEEYSVIALKRRCAYNIVCYDNDKEEAKGVQIWEISYRYSEKQLLLAAKLPRGGGWIPYASYNSSGKTISFEVADDSYRTVEGIKFVDRNYDLPVELIENAYKLDECVTVKSYDEIKSIMQAGGDDASAEAKEKEESEIRPRTRGAVGLASPNITCTGFGVAIDKMKDCEICDVYNNCAEKKRNDVLLARGTTGGAVRRTRKDSDDIPF